MALDTISREEFDRRLDTANAKRTKELQRLEDEQAKAEHLLSYYEHALSEIEEELDGTKSSMPYSDRLRKRLNELAEKTASIAASV